MIMVTIVLIVIMSLVIDTYDAEVPGEKGFDESYKVTPNCVWHHTYI